jgi:RNA polymerase sigma factor (sigma-70 family)
MDGSLENGILSTGRLDTTREAVYPSMATGETSHLRDCLDRLRQGDQAATGPLIEAVCERLRSLAHVMLRDYPRVKRWEETADVVQNALIRLLRALQTVVPPSPRDFYRLATLQVRRELLDLARHYYGPEGAGAHHHTQRPDAAESPSAHAPADVSLEPGRLALWSEFHQQAEALPEEEREVFDLIWYQGFGHTEAAELLQVHPRTVKRRWQSACLKLHDALHGDLPGL